MKLKNNNETISIKFGEHLKDLRKYTHISQKEFAARLGVPESTYANWEQGRREPSIADILAIIRTLEIDANELFDID